VLHPDIVKSVGFVVPQGSDKPEGTCFLVQLQSIRHAELTHGYVVTANHCVIPKTDYDVWMTDASGNLEKLNEIREWERDDVWDIAVAAWYREAKQKWIAPRIPDLLYSSLDLAPGYGDIVLYPGLLEPIASMSQRGQPMVRSATVGFIDAVDVAYGSGYREGPNWVAPKAHIIDCRSWIGFSGSPCWLVDLAPAMPAISAGAKPPPTVQQQLDTGRWEWIGTTTTFHGLWGMLVGYTVKEPHSVGVVIPIEQIVDVIERSDNLKKQRDEETVAFVKAKTESSIEAISNQGEEAPVAGYHRDDFLTDLRRVTRRTGTSRSGEEAPGTSA